jgi:hypothetical protein
LSRLESGKNPRPTFETLARYAAGVGLDVEIVVRDRARCEPRPRTEDEEFLTVRMADLDQLVALIQSRIDALRASGQRPASPGNGADEQARPVRSAR